MSTRELRIRLTLAQSGLMLQALAELPFKSVFELIGNLNQQAHQLFASDTAPQTEQVFLFQPAELARAIKALGELPYNRVNALLQHIHQQLQEQRPGTVLDEADDGQL